jgi:hypothetical protein
MAEEAKIAIKVTAEGTAQAAKEIDKVTASLERQRKTEEMIAKTSDDIRRKNKVTAIQAEAAAQNQLFEATQRTSASATQVATAIGGTTQQFGKFRSSIAASASLMGGLGAQFATLVPATGAMTKALQVGGASMAQFLGVLGGGPGMLLGGAVAAVGALAAYMSSATKEADELAKATEANAKAMGSYLNQVQKLRSEVTAAQAQKRDEGSLYSRLSSNRGSVSEYEAEIGTIEARLGNDYYSQSRIDRLYQSGTGRDEIVKTQQALAALQKRLEQMRGGLSYAQSEAAAAAQQAAEQRAAGLDFDVAGTPGAGGAAGGGGRGVDTFGLAQENQERIARLKQMEEQYSMEQRARTWEDQDIAIEAARAKEEESVAALERQHTYEREQMEITAAIRDREAAKERQQRQQLAMIGMQTSQMMAGAALKGISEVAKGHKLQIGQLIEGIGDQMVAQGTAHLFQALAMSVIPGAQAPGAALYGIAIGEIAAGIGLGAAGARAPGGSAAEAKEADRSGRDNPRGGPTDTDPYRNTFTPTGAQPATINIYLPSVLSPTAEDGVRIRDALKQATNVYGAPV